MLPYSLIFKYNHLKIRKKSICFQYDFGDPLIVRDAVYGLFVGADDLIPGEYPMLYTDVTKYKKWINKYIHA